MIARCVIVGNYGSGVVHRRRNVHIRDSIIANNSYYRVFETFGNAADVTAVGRAAHRAESAAPQPSAAVPGRAAAPVASE